MKLIHNHTRVSVIRSNKSHLTKKPRNLTERDRMTLKNYLLLSP